MDKELKVFIYKSLYAGILIGIGDIAYIALENKILAACLFSLGLLTVIERGLNLYTGKIGYHALPVWKFIVMFAGNFVGIALTVLCTAYYAKPDMVENMKAIAEAKFSKGYIAYVILGILCGMCMYIAVSCKNKIITILAIMMFILCGFEHCIADIPYFLVYMNPVTLVKLLLVVLGNSVGAIFLNILDEGKWVSAKAEKAV